ncbi:MAG: hypothetical protein Q9220_000482 [cf. Caloplaca sp. 1 TL-2023]
MAEPPPPSAAISAAFPAPPPFYKSFTSTNLSRLSSLRDSNPSITSSSLPPDLHNLLSPPPPPSNQPYRLFGETHQQQQISPPQAPTDPPSPPKEPPNPHRLLQTTRQLLLTFLSLTHSLATDPDTWAPKWDEMRALFSEAHGIVNEYRPHQARETLIFMMEEQVEKCRAETRAGEEICERVRKVVEEVEGGGEGVGKVRGDGGAKKGGDEKMRGEKRMWEVIAEEVGSFD